MQSPALSDDEVRMKSPIKFTVPWRAFEWGLFVLGFVLVGANAFYLWRSRSAGEASTPVRAEPDVWASLSAALEEEGAPAFVVDPKALGQSRPILLGAVHSGALRSPCEAMLDVVVYPAEGAAPGAPAWESRVPVQEGFFTVGPLVAKCRGLSPGFYRAFVQTATSYLGWVDFEIARGDGGMNMPPRSLPEVEAVAQARLAERQGRIPASECH